MECKEDHLLEVAKALLLLSSTPPPDRQLASTTHRFKPHPLPPAAMPVTNIENVLSRFLPPWGFRSRRSRCTGMSKRKQVDGPSSSAAVAGAACGHGSPDTPLDLGAASDPSTSGSDGLPSSSEIPPFKRFRADETSAAGCDAHIKVNEAEQSPMVEVVRPSSQPIKRQGRKKTKSELQAEERFLLEDKERLMKILEFELIEREAILEENRRLEFELIEREAILEENRRLLNELASSHTAPAEAEPAKSKFVLPDLNEPVLEQRVEPGCNVN